MLCWTAIGRHPTFIPLTSNVSYLMWQVDMFASGTHKHKGQSIAQNRVRISARHRAVEASAGVVRLVSSCPHVPIISGSAWFTSVRRPETRLEALSACITWQLRETVRQVKWRGCGKVHLCYRLDMDISGRLSECRLEDTCDISGVCRVNVGWPMMTVLQQPPSGHTLGP